MKGIQKKKQVKYVWFFILEVVIPFILAPFIPKFIKDCTDAESFIIGLCFSVFIAVWTLTNSVNNDREKFDWHRTNTAKGFEKIDQRLDSFRTFTDFKDSIEQIKSPYFRKIINLELQKSLDEFRKNNNSLFDGYYTTTPYSSHTFGAEGLYYTKEEILAVSSVNDYWERTAFITSYLETQYFLINERKIKIKRIFVGTRDKLTSVSNIMRDQLKHGIEVYCLYTDDNYCANDWKNADFLIQDGTTVVELKAQTHKPDPQSVEIITTRESILNEKKELFNTMLRNSEKMP